MIYTLSHYGMMIRDSVRTDAYYNALKVAIQPGDVVLDIGAGTGIFSFLAIQLGASHVYAVDPNPLIDVGQMIADANGYTSKVTFHKGPLDSLVLSNPVDVVVGDVRGRLPFLSNSITLMQDARTKFMKPDGILIPQVDHLFATLIEADETYGKYYQHPWTDKTWDINMRTALSFQTNMHLGVKWRASDADKFKVLLDGQSWASLHYPTIDDLNVAGSIRWENIQTQGTAHFILLWFETELSEGIGYTSGPFENGAKAYGQVLLPLARPITLSPSMNVELKLKVHMVHQQYEYDWTTMVWDANDDAAAATTLKQSTLFSVPRAGLPTHQRDYMPVLSNKGQIALDVLKLVEEGDLSVKGITERILQMHPDYFSSPQQAHTFIAAFIKQNT